MRKLFIALAIAGFGLYHGLCSATDAIMSGAPAVAIVAHNDRNNACMLDPMSDLCLSGNR